MRSGIATVRSVPLGDAAYDLGRKREVLFETGLGIGESPVERAHCVTETAVKETRLLHPERTAARGDLAVQCIFRMAGFGLEA